MAIYHLSVKPISRSKGRSTVAAAAYRAAQTLTDFRSGVTHRYAGRKGVADAAILAPPHAPAWVHSREALWNTVEATETRRDARTAREITLALPRELDHSQKRELVHRWLEKACVAEGMVADVALHDLDEGNPHAHVLLTTRRLDTVTGCFGKKVREWDSWTDAEMVNRWRVSWEKAANQALLAAGRTARIDHRSLAEQGVGRLPTVHVGPKWSALNRRRPDQPMARRDQRSQSNAAVAQLNGARLARWQQAASRRVAARVATAHYARLIAAWERERDEARLRRVTTQPTLPSTDALLVRMRGYQRRKNALARQGTDEAVGEFERWCARARRRLDARLASAEQARVEAGRALEQLESLRQQHAEWRSLVRGYADERMRQ